MSRDPLKRRSELRDDDEAMETFARRDSQSCMKRKRTLMSAAALMAAATTASAVSLYWGETPVKTASVKTCISFADDAMRGVNMRNIRRSPNEIAGTSSGGAYAAITCIGTSERATAMVMVAGDNASETQRVRDALRTKIAGITLID